MQTSFETLASATLLAGLMGTFAMPANADAVTDWNERLVQVMLAERTNAPMQSRNAAIVHVAIFEAVNSIERKYAAYRSTQQAPDGASAEAAAAVAAHSTMLALYPAQKSKLDEALARSLLDIPDGDGKRSGNDIGKRAAESILALRLNDGSQVNPSYTPASGPGAWVPNPGVPALTPGWGKVKTWVLSNGAQFRPEQPPAVDSDQFKRDYLEVMEVGGKSSTRRTSEQTQIASFWIPPGVPMWSPVARQLSQRRGLNISQTAQLFALLFVASADAITACWDTKYTYNNFRPVTGIRAGAGRSDLPTDAAWEPAVATPPFPAYVSGHACFGGAAMAVLEASFGSGQIPSVTILSPTIPGYKRSYTSLMDIGAEASDARIWGGIHWRTDQVQGEVLGRKVGAWAVERAMRAIP